jgi:ribose-phosphate pyrophosphokinase
MIMLKDVLILADRNGKAWKFTEEIYTKLKNHAENERNYGLGGVEIKKFNDGEIFVTILDNVRNKTCFYIHDSSIPNPQDWAFSLTQVNDALKRSSANKINDVLPYMHYSRQDSMNEPRTPISSRLLADLINKAAYRVITADIHNPAITGCYNIPFDNLPVSPTITKYLNKNYGSFLKDAVVVAPDVGGAKRAGRYSEKLNLEMTSAYKKRKRAGVVEKIEIMGDLDGRNVLMPDDMIDTGGTLIKAAEKAKEKGAKSIYAIATHGILSNDAREKLEKSVLEKIIVTDSIPQESNGKIEVVSLIDLFAETIYNICHGRSVSASFK